MILEVGGDSRQAGAMSGRSREESYSEDEEEEGVEERAVPEVTSDLAPGTSLVTHW